MRRKKPFNKVEEILQVIPTWIFVIAAVVLIGCLSLSVHEDSNSKSTCNTLGFLFLFKYTKLICDGISVLLQSAESLSIVAAAVLYFKETPNRKSKKHYEAWQVIDNAAAAGTSTSYARKQALEDLVRDGVSLKGLDIPGSDLIDANLKNAILGSADLSGADLRWADLSGSILFDTNLSGANLNGTNLSGADLRMANLSNANLAAVDFSGVNLFTANLSNADLSGANLSGVTQFSLDPIQQIQSAKNWRNADYAPEIKKLLEIS